MARQTSPTRSEPLSAADYLALPYARMVTPDSDGTYFGQILEFPGCLSSGDTAAEALANLENVAEGWLEAALANGQKIPKPVEESDFSGKLMLRLPKSLHKEAALAAGRDGVSLNQFIVMAIGIRVGEIDAVLSLRSSTANFNAIQQFNYMEVSIRDLPSGNQWNPTTKYVGESHAIEIFKQSPFVNVVTQNG